MQRVVHAGLGVLIVVVLSVGIAAALVRQGASVHPTSAVAYTDAPADVPAVTDPPPAPPTTVVGAVVAPPPAPPSTTTPAAPRPGMRAADVGPAALALIDYPWQQLGYTVRFESSTAGLLGMTDCASRAVTIFVRPSQTVRQVAFVTAFELAHAVDCTTMNRDRRAQWASIRTFTSGWRWFPGCLCPEDTVGSGDFSMVFASWLVPNGGYPWRSSLAPPPNADQLRALMPYLRPAS